LTAKLRPIGAVVLLAAAVRIAFVVSFLRDPVSDIVPQDMVAYTELGRAISSFDLDHRLFDYVNAPYAFVIAPFTLLSPAMATGAVAALQVVLDLVAVVLVGWVGGRTFGPRTGLAAALLYALYGAAVYYTAIVLPVTLSIVAFIGAVAALMVCRERSPRWAMWAGAVLGALVLIRPNAAPLAGVATWWLWTAGARRLALFGAGIALVLAPFTARSLATGHGLSPFPVNGGLNFYIGNNPEAIGTYMHVENVDDRPMYQIVTSVEEASRRAGRTLDERTASAFWLEEALHWMGREPAAALRLLLLKVAWLLRTEEVSLNASYPLARERLAILAPTLTFGMLVPLACWGLVAALLSRETRRDPNVRLLVAMAVVFAASVAAFFISDRYRIPIAGPVAVLAGHGLVTLTAVVRNRRTRLAAAGLAVMAAAALGANYRFPPFRFEEPMPRFSLAAAYFERGRADEGLAQCEVGLAIADDLPQGHHCRAAGYLMKGDVFGAETELRAALLRLGAFKTTVRADLATLYARVGLFEDALRVTDDEGQRAQLQQAYAEQNRNAPDRASRAETESAAGAAAAAARRFTDARYAYKRALQADPKRVAAWRGLARACGELELVEEGCEAASQAVWLAADDADARAEQSRLCGRR